MSETRWFRDHIINRTAGTGWWWSFCRSSPSGKWTADTLAGLKTELRRCSHPSCKL